MTIFAESVRASIAAASVNDAKRGTLRMVRFALRKRIFRYAQRHYITDFNDPIVTERHRVWRQTALTNAQDLATQANAATTIAEILVVLINICLKCFSSVAVKVRSFV